MLQCCVIPARCGLFFELRDYRAIDGLLCIFDLAGRTILVVVADGVLQCKSKNEMR